MTAERRIRVLLSFDSTHPSEEMLNLLPLLLGPTPLELTGLYVEDEDVLRAAALPGLREVTLNGQISSLDPERMLREQAEEASAIRGAFEKLAAAMRLHHRFLITRGRTGEELSRIAAESDFVLVARALRSSGLRPRRGMHYDRLVRLPKNILFVNEPWQSGSSVVVLHPGREALEAGRRFAQAEELRLVQAVAPEAAGTVSDSKGSFQGEAQRVRLQEWTEEAIADLCLAEDARLLIVPQTASLDWDELLPKLMDRLPCSVLRLG